MGERVINLDAADADWIKCGLLGLLAQNVRDRREALFDLQIPAGPLLSLWYGPGSGRAGSAGFLRSPLDVSVANLERLRWLRDP